MKKIILLAILFISIQSIAQTNVENSIKQLIAKESEHFYNRDFKSWSNCYVQTNKTYWSCIEKGDIVLEAIKWKNIAKFVGDYIKENPTPLTVKIDRSNYTFTNYGKAVWVTFDEILQEPSITKKLRGVRIVEKNNGTWKIVYMNSYPQP